MESISSKDKNPLTNFFLLQILDYKIHEAKALASTIQSNLSELYNDTSNHDATKNLSFWFNILGALGTVYCQTLPIKHR